MRAAVLEHGVETPETTAAANDIGKAARNRALLTARILGEARPLLTPEQLERVEAALHRDDHRDAAVRAGADGCMDVQG